MTSSFQRSRRREVASGMPPSRPLKERHDVFTNGAYREGPIFRVVVCIVVVERVLNGGLHWLHGCARSLDSRALRDVDKVKRCVVRQMFGTISTRGRDNGPRITPVLALKDYNVSFEAIQSVDCRSSGEQPPIFGIQYLRASPTLCSPDRRRKCPSSHTMRSKRPS